MPDTTTQGIEIKLDNGNVIKADSIEEAFKVAVKMVEDNSKAYRETKSQFDGLQSQFSDLQQQVARQAAPPPSNGNSFDKNKYYSMLNDDPMQAQNYLDAYRFGIGDPAQVPAYFQDTVNKVSVMEQNMLAATFTSMHEDFPQTQEAAKKLTDEVLRLSREGHPTNLSTMDMAWRNCVQGGSIKPLEQRQQEDNDLPPSLPAGGGSFVPDAEISKAESMSTNDLEAYLRSKGMIR